MDGNENYVNLFQINLPINAWATILELFAFTFYSCKWIIRENKTSQKFKIISHHFFFTFITENDDGCHAYVLKVTNILQSPGKHKYFNVILHDGNSETRAVSYKPGLHPMFSNARSADKVVKILNFKQIHDPFHGKDVLSLGDQGSVEYSSKEIPFESVKQVSHTLNQIT